MRLGDLRHFPWRTSILVLIAFGFALVFVLFLDSFGLIPSDGRERCGRHGWGCIDVTVTPDVL